MKTELLILIFAVMFTVFVTILLCETMHEYQIRALNAQAHKSYCAEEVTYPELIGGE